MNPCECCGRRGPASPLPSPAALAALFALAVHAASAIAVDWLPFHASADGMATHYYDWDSLRQTADGFGADIRLVSGPAQRAATAHLEVDCQAATWRLSKAGDEGEAPLPIGASIVAPLQQTFCARWREPAMARWRQLGATHQGDVSYDERLAAAPAGFAARVRLLGEPESYLAEFRVDCPAGRYAVPALVARDERRGLLVNQAAIDWRPIEAGSIAALLKTAHCPADLPAAVFTGRPARPDLVSHPRARRFAAELAEAAAEGANFAGHFRLTRFGCGCACNEWAIQDLKSGRVFFPAELRRVDHAGLDESWFDAEGQPLLFSADSRLLRVAGRPAGRGAAAVSWLAWDGNRFRRLRHFPLAPSPAAPSPCGHPAPP